MYPTRKERKEGVAILRARMGEEQRLIRREKEEWAVGCDVERRRDVSLCLCGALSMVDYTHCEIHTKPPDIFENILPITLSSPLLCSQEQQAPARVTLYRVASQVAQGDLSNLPIVRREEGKELQLLPGGRWV